MNSEMNFYIQTPTGSAGDYLMVLLKGTALGGGWNDDGTHINGEYYSWDEKNGYVRGFIKVDHHLQV